MLKSSIASLIPLLCSKVNISSRFPLSLSSCSSVISIPNVFSNISYFFTSERILLISSRLFNWAESIFIETLISLPNSLLIRPVSFIALAIIQSVSFAKLLSSLAISRTSGGNTYSDPAYFPSAAELHMKQPVLNYHAAAGKIILSHSFLLIS